MEAAMLAEKDGTTLPGWRDFERAVASSFDGEAQESKAVFDVVIVQLPYHSDVQKASYRHQIGSLLITTSKTALLSCASPSKLEATARSKSRQPGSVVPSFSASMPLPSWYVLRIRRSISISPGYGSRSTKAKAIEFSYVVVFTVTAPSHTHL